MKFIGRVRFVERSLLLIILLKDYIKVIFYINMKNVNLVMSMPQSKTAHLHSNVWTTTKIIRKGFMRVRQKNSKTHFSSVIGTLTRFA